MVTSGETFQEGLADDPEIVRSMTRTASLGLVLVIVVVFTIGAATSSKDVNMEFYSAASQIIPLLFIVLAIEVRVFRLPPTATLRRAWKSASENDAANMVLIGGIMGTVLVYILAGEYWAMRPLSTRPAAEPGDQGE